MERVIGIDRERREVVTDMSRIAFDYLIIATGARHHYFGNEAWETIAPGLKKIDEATEIRSRILTAFELAEASFDGEERRRHLTFAVVGAGPTGVEMAGAIAELARHAVVRDFRRIDTANARILLIEAGERVLASFPPELSEKAKRQLEKLGVEVMLRHAVTACDEAGLTLSGGERIACSSIVWAAGVMASPAAKWLGEASDRAGRVPIGPDAGGCGIGGRSGGNRAPPRAGRARRSLQPSRRPSGRRRPRQTSGAAAAPPHRSWLRQA